MTTVIKSKTDAARAPQGRHSVHGAAGLYLMVGAPTDDARARGERGGRRSWAYRYRAGTARREMGLGKFPDVSIDAARRMAAEFKVETHKGLDPKLERDRREQEAEAARKAAENTVTFEEAAKAYVAEHAKNLKGQYAEREWVQPLRDYVYPIIGKTPVAEIGVAHVREVLIKAKTQVIARRVLERMRLVLGYAGHRGWRDEEADNPATLERHKFVPIVKKKMEHERHPRPELDDAPAIFRKLRENAETDTGAAAWVLMIATATRPREALNARWEEFDLGRKLWVIPKERMKMGKAHTIPLNAIALEALARQTRCTGGRKGPVFPGKIAGHTLTYFPFRQAGERLGDGLDAKAPHGWRGVFRDAVGEGKVKIAGHRVERDLAELALAHVVGGVEGHYRTETAIEERRPVMEAYANWLMGKSDNNVVPFPSAAA